MPPLSDFYLPQEGYSYRMAVVSMKKQYPGYAKRVTHGPLRNNTPIDYLVFTSPVSGLGAKVGFDATNKWSDKTSREWARATLLAWTRRSNNGLMRFGTNLIFCKYN